MKKFIYPLALLALPAITSAQTFGGNGGIGSIISFIGNVMTAVIPLIIGAAVVLFLWGILRFVTSGGDPEKRTEARNTMIYGVIAIFVMVSVWGLVNVLVRTFNLDSTNIPVSPRIPPPAIY